MIRRLRSTASSSGSRIQLARPASRRDAGSSWGSTRPEGRASTDSDMDYEFEAAGFAAGTATGGTVAPADEQPAQIRSGAFEDMARGRGSDVSCACHWAVNAASTAEHGKMYGLAYSVCPSGIFVAADS